VREDSGSQMSEDLQVAECCWNYFCEFRSYDDDEEEIKCIKEKSYTVYRPKPDARQLSS
jgi:hypothetical protein